MFLVFERCKYVSFGKIILPHCLDQEEFHCYEKKQHKLLESNNTKKERKKEESESV